MYQKVHELVRIKLNKTLYLVPIHSSIHSLTPWLYGPLKNLASINKDAHSLSTAFCHHLLTFISHRSFSTSSSHLNPSLPLHLLMSNLLPNIFLTVLPWSILTTCPIHSNLFFLISATMSRPLHSSLISWLVIILHIPYSTTGPYNLLNILLSHVLSLFISNSIKAHVSLPHTTTGFTIFKFQCFTVHFISQLSHSHQLMHSF